MQIMLIVLKDAKVETIERWIQVIVNMNQQIGICNPLEIQKK
jgi:hypothetical protein